MATKLERLTETLEKLYPHMNPYLHHSGGGVMLAIFTRPDGRTVRIGDLDETFSADVLFSPSGNDADEMHIGSILSEINTETNDLETVARFFAYAPIKPDTSYICHHVKDELFALLARAYPRKHGDMPPDAIASLTASLENAAKVWIETNTEA